MMNWLTVVSASLVLLALVGPARNAHLHSGQVLANVEESGPSTTTQSNPTAKSWLVLNNDTSALGSTASTIDVNITDSNSEQIDANCAIICNSTLGEICSPSLRGCICPIHTFRSSETGRCKAQVAVDVQLISPEFINNFTDVVKWSDPFVEISPHIELDHHREMTRATIYIEAEFFNRSWTEAEESLRYLFGTSEYKHFLNLTVTRDPCNSTKTRPCSSNALCITSTRRYHVECFCRFGYRDLSAGSGRNCVHERRCINGGLPYLRSEGPDAERFGCRCLPWFAGEDCSFDLLRIGLTGLVIIWMVVIAIGSHPLHCMTLLHRCRVHYPRDVVINRPPPDISRPLEATPPQKQP